MGAARADVVVKLQAALMRAVHDFGDQDVMSPHRDRALATAASLDYVLMLASEAPGARIPARDADRAMREGIERAVDDAIASAQAIVAIGTPEARSFARETAHALRTIVRTEGLETMDRAFALIALANP